ncbi:MAG TPA: VOC family protein [Casimicrobiaceae bacterium]|nr:VOC family protein [Casimicrobiaceae bacterium]
MTFDPASLRDLRGAGDVSFHLRKIGHVVLRARDLRKSVEFYVKVLGFAISDVYAEDMVPGGMVFMRYNPDHHGVALVGGMPGASEKRELHHFAFEVDTLDEVFLARKRLREHGVKIVFEGRRRAGVQIAVEFLDPDGHHLEIYWGLDRVGVDGHVRPGAEWREAHTLEEALTNPPPGQSVSLKDPSLIERR